MANLAINGILEKMTGKDKDYRYMATSDLLNELSKDSFKADSDLEIKVSNTVLQQLDDAAGDVSGLAVKCLAPLVKKVSQDRVLDMTEKLCDRLLHGKDQHRDTASIALKTIVSEITATAVALRILESLTPQLIQGISSTGLSTEIKCECLDILCDVLHRFGNLMTHDHLLLLRSLLSQLSSNQASVRKKSISCIASLSSSLSDDLLAAATVEVVQLLKKKGTKPELTRTNIQMIGAFSRAVGYRFGPHLSETVPMLISYCVNASEVDEELREYSLQALESFLLRCPRDISVYCNEILDLTLEYLSYDPNFTDNMEEDTDNENLEDEEEDEESANEYSDDEDISWKVRRAAAKCLSAVIVSRPEMLSILYKEACPKLIERFKEREENVKMDVFNAFIELLRQTGNVTKGQVDIQEYSPLWMLKQEVQKIVRSINKQLREKSIKTKVGAFSVLRELVVVLPDCLADHIGSLVPGIEKALSDKSSTSNLKIEALIFTRLVMASHLPSVFHPYIKALSGPILSAVSERYYKVTAEALRVCGELVRVIRPNIEETVFDFRPYVRSIYTAILLRLANQDQDQEVKECAISCMGLVISTFGDDLQMELPTCLPVLVDRMGNEITRLTAVKAFAVIASSPLKIDLSCVLDHVLAELTAFLRKANRALRQASLGTLNSLVVAYGDRISTSTYESIIVELSALISDSDLHMTASALELCCTMMADRKFNKDVGLSVRQIVLPQALVLVRSSLLQGQALQALQSFFAALVHSANTSFDVLLDSLLFSAKPSPQSGGLAKQALYSIAQCVAVLCLAAGDNKCASTVEMLTSILKDDNNTNSAKQHLALLCLGEIGRRKDLSSHRNIENIVIESFQSPFEEIKSAASYALGNIAVGNLSKYLPFILDQIDNQQKKQYLLLHSLKEVIARQSMDKAGQVELQDQNVEKILRLLFNHCESEEEGVRNVVAECLGKIALIEPKKLVPALQVRTTCPAGFTRATVAIAVKYSIVERPEKIDDVIYPAISSFLMLIKDDDRHVRRAAVSALSTAAHNKPNLIKGLLPELLPLLYDQTVVKQELIRTVDLGPFKHIVDDGLELRKAAFECVDTLLDSCLDQVNPSSFIVPYLKAGLDDHYDVKMPCHLILSKLADKCPSAVLAVLDSLVGPLEKTISHRPKQDAVKQEVDRNEDMIRSALRAIASLNHLSGGEYSPKFKMLMNTIMKTPNLIEKYNAVRCE
ncbi:cullin-associated NEDD8-dissociated protein 1 isoform X1 [Amborella trichopoda]|nr:cullin-associated NEDD8-dissociated protein 1 isoform X1 [Amborella trichopoda]XP_011621012.1 cullin-associated NEDD8-dissociated protein 1 isoform X1 [Amborella trichopoda]XP_020518959.1 cullin-associated NEDD8-dissociated protein 1 isoform X1 [Amborella trichopoda]XP_020518960.1 cullin-associated NEDD8-dissociated protein 1 isoform X1 [Amborella trichopoda]XP_020518961.1 cullin-associated NEDD8-dissociated protein 1 isoform X1 [Amborella trichopoda]XP_020518962.1 cullin-associated NEDD8-d|eukprot:XP_006836907.2 cullin-associated NEDD8-dissociated protein 1 isoform X1 [Amborella trichopoda]